jgi:predicted dehydrogenase
MAACGVHTVDTFRYLAGPAKRVAAFTKQIVGSTALDDATSVMIEYESGPVGMIGTSYFVGPVVSVAAYGTEANVWNEEDGARLYVQRRSEPARAELSVDRLDTIGDQLEEFGRCIRDGGAPETGGAAGLEVAVVLEAILRSAESGSVVETSTLR